jgi:NitT/TauT family transport system permease protein
MRKRDLFLAALALVIAWEILALILNRDILPAPLTVVSALVVELPRRLAADFLVSAWRVVASIALAIMLGTPAGLVLGQFEKLNRFFAPLIYLTYPIPKIVLLPVIFLFLGIGDATKIAVVFLILFFQVLVVVRDQSAALRPELIYSVQSLGAGRRALLRFVFLPATLPAVLTALRVSVGTAVAVLYYAETFATTQGLGYYIATWTAPRAAYPEMYAGIVAMSVLGLILYFIVDYLERVLCPYLFAK